MSHAQTESAPMCPCPDGLPDEHALGTKGCVFERPDGESGATFHTINGGHNCGGCGAQVPADPRFTEHYPDCEVAL